MSVPKSKGIYLKERLLCRITENGSGEKVDAPVSSVYVLCRQVSGLSSGMTLASAPVQEMTASEIQ